jgi:hypothetical protein
MKSPRKRALSKVTIAAMIRAASSDEMACRLEAEGYALQPVKQVAQLANGISIRLVWRRRTPDAVHTVRMVAFLRAPPGL